MTKISEEELEQWYDELYQMILLAFLSLDNKDREPKVDEFLKRLTEKTKNDRKLDTN